MNSPFHSNLHSALQEETSTNTQFTKRKKKKKTEITYFMILTYMLTPLLLPFLLCGKTLSALHIASVKNELCEAVSARHSTSHRKPW